jgi:hypothetical protein
VVRRICGIRCLILFRAPIVCRPSAWLALAACALAAVCGCQGEKALPPAAAQTQSAKKFYGRRIQLPKLGQKVAREAVDESALRPRDDDFFEDATERSGVRFAYRNGREAGKFFILESLGGGVAMIDYDLDGDLDLAFAGGGTFEGDPVQIKGLPSAFYRNDEEWRFRPITPVVHLNDQPSGYSHCMTVTDFDADGLPDLFLTCYGFSRLYRNLGDGTFAGALSPEEFPAHGWGTSAAWADIDRDGFPELYLGHYLDWSPETEQACHDQFGNRDVCGPAQYPGAVGKFLHNSGDGTFEDWSQRVGLAGGVKGLGAVACDFDADGWIDFYAANDETPNQLYLGRPDATFREVGRSAGVAFNEYGVEEGSMGIGVNDFDGDGLPDLFVTNFENEDNALYRNLGGGQFKHDSVAMGVSGHSRMMVGFGTALVDFDLDGWPDLFIANGNAVYSMGQAPYEQPPQFFLGVEGRRFENVSERGGSYFRARHVGRGVAAGDLDDDGALDLIVVHQNEPVALLRNRTPAGSFVRVQLRATRGQTDAIGAHVVLLSGPRAMVRHMVHGAGYFSQWDPRVVFPAPAGASTVDLAVQWLGRKREVFRNLQIGSLHVLVEGQGHDEPR